MQGCRCFKVVLSRMFNNQTHFLVNSVDEYQLTSLIQQMPHLLRHLVRSLTKRSPGTIKPVRLPNPKGCSKRKQLDCHWKSFTGHRKVYKKKVLSKRTFEHRNVECEIRSLQQESTHMLTAYIPEEYRSFQFISVGNGTYPVSTLYTQLMAMMFILNGPINVGRAPCR
jgi:hypothetical protein